MHERVRDAALLDGVLLQVPLRDHDLHPAEVERRAALVVLGLRVVAVALARRVREDAVGVLLRGLPRADLDCRLADHVVDHGVDVDVARPQGEDVLVELGVEREPRPVVRPV